MKPKSSAHYQREYRRRLREQGLVKKEVWIRPEHARHLAALEKALRAEHRAPPPSGAVTMNDDSPTWTTLGLRTALQGSDLVTSGRTSVGLIDGIEPSLELTMHEYGDLPVFVTVFGEQIVAESVLWPIAEVRDPAAFNDMVLRTHKYFPLSTISLDRLADGRDYYQMFGALSASSALADVVLEVELLASNVIQATEAFREFLATPVEA